MATPEKEIPTLAKTSEVTYNEAEMGIDNVDNTEKTGTMMDKMDMARMGKQQELKRNYRFISILGFTCILMSTWETQLTASTFGLINGGLAGLIWTYIGTFFGFLAVIASMAEMASMAPTAGGQYHWVSEFAPRSCQKFLSYVTGWICVLAWQTGVTSLAFLAALQIQSLLVLNDASYVFKPWHGTLLIIAISFFAILFNTYLAKRLPLIHSLILVLHIGGFLVIVTPLWILAPRNSASVVFTQFTDGGNWGDIGLSCLIGMLSPIFSFIGPDSATHMSEEIKDASRTLPLAMIWTAILNGSLGFVMLITFCFCLGNIENILADPEIMPFVQVFYAATKSHAGASVMTAILIVLTVSGCITNITTASRQMFAFARDQGLPFSRFLAHVKPGWDVPVNSVIVSFVITILLSLINIGSTTAFNAIASLGIAALLSSYIVSITCILIKRWRHERLPPTRWGLGRYGMAINAFSVAYLVIVFIFCFFPIATPVTASTMNWNILIYGVVLVFASSYFFLKGRHVYLGPVVYVNKDT